MTTSRRLVSPRRRLAIWQRDRFTCTYCGASALGDTALVLDVDHVIPVAQGGTNADDNLTTACRPCNVKKGPGRRHQPSKPTVKRAPRPINAFDCHDVCPEIRAFLLVRQVGRTDKQLAALLGCSSAHISNLLSGKRHFSWETIKRAGALFSDIRQIVWNDLTSKPAEVAS